MSARPAGARAGPPVVCRSVVCVLAVAGICVIAPIAGPVAPVSAAVQPRAAGPTDGLLGSAWVAGWAASPTRATLAVPARSTVRMAVPVELSGTAARVRLSNASGTAPVTVGDVYLGRSGGGATVVAGTNRRVTFDGRGSTTIAAGTEEWSDPVGVAAVAGRALTVSFFVDRAAALTTLDDSTATPSYVARGTDVAPGVSARGFGDAIAERALVDGVAVDAPPHDRLVVAFGDSITAGYHVDPTPNTDWPSLLADRLRASPGSCPTSVVDEAISGNRLTLGSIGTMLGASGEERFGRDVLALPGVRTVIVLLGINDVGSGAVTAGQLIAGYRVLIAAAHAHHVRIIGGTLTPAGDPAAPTVLAPGYSSARAVAVRTEVNRWIRTSGSFDGVVDFSRALGRAGDPNELAPRYDSGDHLHPDDTGAARMAAAVPTALLGTCTGAR